MAMRVSVVWIDTGSEKASPGLAAVRPEIAVFCPTLSITSGWKEDS